MQHHDTNRRFIIEDSPIRGEWTLLDSTYKAVIAKHQYPLEIQMLLGEMMAAAVMLSSTLKFEGLLIIQARGNDTLKLATVECTHDKGVRAVAQWDGDVSGKNFRSLLNKATLAITISPKEGQRYQGIIPLERDTLAECLEDYFERSEQLKTRIWLAEGNEKAAGLMVQFMPYNSEINKPAAEQEEDWQRVTLLSDTLTAEEHLGLDPETLLRRLFNEEDVRLLADENVRFECSCSKQRFADSLTTIPREELETIIKEQGAIETRCQFCNETYQFDAVDIHAIYEERAQHNPDQHQNKFN
ncbi:MAG: Hsp33 family molecular chaperone HslO [Gammaproteobacteria bacterium]|nr:MAG: Hsp33 family molecular chaperone HslO [Gammaproteobacteria bacterium]